MWKLKRSSLSVIVKFAQSSGTFVWSSSWWPWPTCRGCPCSSATRGRSRSPPRTRSSSSWCCTCNRSINKGLFCAAPSTRPPWDNIKLRLRWIFSFPFSILCYYLLLYNSTLRSSIYSFYSHLNSIQDVRYVAAAHRDISYRPTTRRGRVRRRNTMTTVMRILVMCASFLCTTENP